MSKVYFVDTNVLIDNPDATYILNDNNQNTVNIHYAVINELDKLKKDPKLNYKVKEVTDNLLKYQDTYNLVGLPTKEYTDDVLLNDICLYQSDNKVLITSDRILQVKAIKLGVTCEDLKRSNPFINTENGDYTGIVDPRIDKVFNNSFFFDEGKFCINKQGEVKEVDLTRDVWKVYPKDYFQSAIFELGLDDSIDILTIQGAAGTGKTYLSLALAFYHVFEKNNYSKIYITKAMYEIGQKMGFLPGDVNEKMAPYMEYIQSLIEKLTNGRKINKLYKDEEKFLFNPRKFQVLPINYIRGRDLEDAFIIIDETQNLSRDEVRTMLSRMGQNVKCICIGDKSQIDNPYLNLHNNGLNWILKKFKDKPNYAHLTIDSKYYRGPICELVVETGL